MDDISNNTSDNTTGDNNPNDTGARNSNFAISIVVVVGILLAIILTANARSEDTVSPTPGPGTPAASQPMATPPTQPVPGEATQPVQIQPTVPVVEPSPIQGIIWQWVSLTDQSTSQTTTVPAPSQYVIVFTPEGFVNGLADCNTFTGTYSLTSGLTITITTMTMAACPDGSLDQQYLQLLASVVAGGPDGAGNLALETAGGAQRMLFQNGGSAK